MDSVIVVKGFCDGEGDVMLDGKRYKAFARSDVYLARKWREVPDVDKWSQDMIDKGFVSFVCYSLCQLSDERGELVFGFYMTNNEMEAIKRGEDITFIDNGLASIIKSWDIASRGDL